MASYNSSFQTAIVKKYLKTLSKKLGNNISIKSVDISLFNKLILTDLYVEDLHQDTLLYAKRLEVDINEFSYEKKKIILEDVDLTNVYFNLKKNKNEKGTSLSFIINHFAKKDTTKNKWLFTIDNLTLINTRFDYHNDNFSKTPAGVDYKNVSITNLDLSLSKIKLINKGIDCKIDHLSLVEQSGFKIEKLTTKINVTPTGIITEDLNIKTPNSDVDGNISFLTKDYKSLSNFIYDVNIQSYFNTSKVSFKDIYYFAPTLNGLNKSLSIEGEVKGTVNNLKGRKLAVLLDDGTRFKGSADISGLPSATDMFMYIKVKELITTKEKLETIPTYPFSKGTFITLPDNFSHLGVLKYKGNFTGFYHDFVTYGTLKTSLGSLKADISLKLNDGLPHYKGRIFSNHFDLGKFSEMRKDIGDISMNLNVDGFGFSIKELDASLTGNIEKIVIKDYEYNNLELKGNFQNQIFKGFLAVEDENISFDFDGSIDLSKKKPEISFISNIENAKLAKLNLVKSTKKLKTRFSTQLRVNLVGATIDDLVGNVEFINSRYNDKLDSIKVENVLISSSFNEEKRKITIKSDLLDAEIEGDFKFKEIDKYVAQFFIRYIPSQIDETHEVKNLSNDVIFNIELHNSELLSKVLFNGVEMSDNCVVHGNYDSKKHNLSILANSPYIDAFGAEIREFSFDCQANESDLNIIIDAAKIYQNDSLYIDNFSIRSKAENDSILTNLYWKNEGNITRNEAEINITTVFDGYNHSSNTFKDSYAYISDVLWAIKPYNEILRDTNNLLVKGLSIYSEKQSVLIDGKLSSNPKDQIDILFKELNLLTFKRLIPERIISLEGIVDGVASIKKQQNEYIFTSDLEFDKFRVNEQLVGKGSLQSIWRPINESLKLNGKFYDGYQEAIGFSGYYYPNREDENLKLSLELYQTELSMFDAYVKDYIEDLSGKANAQVTLTGTLKRPKLEGYLTLQNTSFNVLYLNTSYRTNLCKIDITPDMISFDNVEFLDKKNNVAIANGTVYHNWFSDWSIDVGLDVNNFLSLNTSEKDNSLYYGKAYATGFVNLSSYGKQLTIDVKVKTEKNTTLNIPLTDDVDLVANNFVEFISNDTTIIDVEEDIDLSNIEMNFDLEVTPDAQIRLIFDEQIGDVMKSKGSGNLNLQINKDGDLNMYGNYVVKDGDYLFTLQNVINKRFDLEEGGTISWNGSPYDAEINLTAIYRTRARLYDLLANVDTNEIYKKRIPVDLKLKMTNKMMSPDINFDIDLPTADGDTRSKVRSVLYLSGQEENIQELNKQVFSLLVLNSFLPPGAESSYSGAGVGSTTSSELISNQLSNMLSKISNDFDLGFNYRPGDELSNQEYELALSTQFFNDRLILDGNLGYSDKENVSTEAQNTNNLIGDISIEYKITKDGKLRVKAFNNSNQFSLEETSSAYTQGLGLSYKEEYDTNKQFWQGFFDRFRRKSEKRNL